MGVWILLGVLFVLSVVMASKIFHFIYRNSIGTTEALAGRAIAIWIICFGVLAALANKLGLIDLI